MKTLLSLLCTLILCVPCYAAPIGLKRFGHNYFGSGIDGFVHLTGNTTWTNTANSDWIIKQCTTFQLNSGKTLTIQNPGKGVIIYTQGNCTISGTINLNGMAGNITPPSEGVWFPATQLRIPSATRYAQSGTTLVASCFDGTSVWMTDANNNGVRKVKYIPIRQGNLRLGQFVNRVPCGEVHFRRRLLQLLFGHIPPHLQLYHIY